MSAEKRRIAPADVARFLTYDPLTGLLAWRPRPGLTWWNTRFAGQVAGTPKRGEIQVSLTCETGHRLYRAHHLAWVLMTGEWPEDEVDHENGDPHDNSWLNLRLASSGQNKENRRAVAGACPFKGVYYHAQQEQYAAQIKHQKSWKWLGLHTTAEAAARAYDAAAEKLHGTFAVTNRNLGLLGAHA